VTVNPVRCLSFTAVLVAGLALTALAKDKETPNIKMVDSGTFGVYNEAHRIATESFSIKQGAEGSVVTSEFKSELGEQKADQTSELQLTPSVGLRHYEWRELSPEKIVATVEPSDPFLVERFTVGTSGKQQEQNFLLPVSTPILDDYFFIQREVLVWKYLATACRQEKTGLGCPLNQKIPFGTLNPHARTSVKVTIEFMGKDKIMIHGSQRELIHFVLRSETGDWAFWLDDQFRLVRLVGDSGTEVVRD
jgi:hypothetical protein